MLATTRSPLAPAGRSIAAFVSRRTPVRTSASVELLASIVSRPLRMVTRAGVGGNWAGVGGGGGGSCTCGCGSGTFLPFATLPRVPAFWIFAVAPGVCFVATALAELVVFAVAVETGLVVLAPLVAVSGACASAGRDTTAENRTNKAALNEGI